jgi:hypothetical protein
MGFYGKEKIKGAERNLPDFFRIVPELSKKISGETFQNCCRRGGEGIIKNSYYRAYFPQNWQISHKIDRICAIYFHNKPILPDCEANIAQLALFVKVKYVNN